MKRTMKRVTALFLAVVMTMSLIGITPIFAEGVAATTSSSEWQIEGESSPVYHIVGATTETNGGMAANVATGAIWNEDENDEGAYVKVAKTIAPTETENEFDITLTVKTNETVTYNANSAKAAVVLVIDNSSSMYQTVSDNSSGGDTAPTMTKNGNTDYANVPSDGVGDGYLDYVGASSINTILYIQNGRIPVEDNNQADWRITQAKDAALDFLDSFTKDADADSRAIAIVSFSNDGVIEENWTYSVEDAKAAVNDIKPVAATNMDGGLVKALDLLDTTDTNNSLIKNISNKYVVLLSDGLPNFYINDTTGSVVTKWDKETGLKQADATATAVKNTGAILYTVSFTYQDDDFDALASEGCAKTALTGVDLTEDLEDIVTTIKNMANAYTVIDPMGSDYIKLDDGSYSDLNNTAWSLTSNQPKTYNYVTTDTDGEGFSWDLRRSSYTEEKSVKTYTMTYTVTLDTALAGFQDEVYYLTNDHTYLTYYFATDINGTITAGDSDALSTIDFNVPAVKGKAPTHTLTVNWVEEGTATDADGNYVETLADQVVVDIRHHGEYNANTDTYSNKETGDDSIAQKDFTTTGYEFVEVLEGSQLSEDDMLTDTVITYVYEKSDDTFTENHYVQVVNGWYYDETGLVQVDAEDDVIKEDGVVTYVLVKTASQTDKIDTKVTVTATPDEVDDTYYDYKSEKTMLDDVADSSLKATIGTDKVMDLFYDFTTTPSFTFTVEHYVQVNANGLYYYDNNWETATDAQKTAGYAYVTTTAPDPSVTVGATVTGGDYDLTLDKYDYQDNKDELWNTAKVNDFVVDETGMTLKLFYNMNDTTEYKYQVNYYVEVVNGSYYDGEWKPVTNTKTFGEKTYQQMETTLTVPVTVYGTPVSVSTYADDDKYTGYKYSTADLEYNDDTLNDGSFAVTDTDDVLNLLYVIDNAPTYSYQVNHYLKVNDEGWYYEPAATENGTVTTWKQATATELVAFQGFDGKYVLHEGPEANPNVAYNTSVTVASEKNTYYLYSYTGADLENNTLSDGSFAVTDTDDVLNLLYTPTNSTKIEYNVQHHLQVQDGHYYYDGAYVATTVADGEYVHIAAEDQGAFETERGTEVSYTTYNKETDFAKYAVNTIKSETITIVEDNMILDVYYDTDSTFSTAVAYTVKHYVEVVNGYYFDETGASQSTTETSWVLVDTQNREANLGDTAPITNEIGNTTKLYTGYANDATLTQLNDAVTAATTFTVAGDEVVELYYTLEDGAEKMDYTVEHHLQVQDGHYYYDGAYVATDVADGAYVHIVAENQGAFETTVGTEVSYTQYNKEETFDKYAVNTIKSETITIVEDNMILDVYYDTDSTFSTAVAYTVKHYVEVVNGYYFDETGASQSTTETSWVLVDTQGREANLGDTAPITDEIGNTTKLYTGYANEATLTELNDAVTDASSFIVEGGEVLELYYTIDEANLKVTLIVQWVDESDNSISNEVDMYSIPFGTVYNTLENLVTDVDFSTDISNKAISGYTFKEIHADSDATDGDLIKDVTTVIYVYTKNSGGNYRPDPTPTPDPTPNPTPDPDPDPVTDIPDGDVPLTDIPDSDVPLTDIPDEDVPLVDIPMEEVPLGNIPQTGDTRNLAFLVTTALVSAAGLGWLVKSELDEKKKHNN